MNDLRLGLREEKIRKITESNKIEVKVWEQDFWEEKVPTLKM